jgi:hypothetical protein
MVPLLAAGVTAGVVLCACVAAPPSPVAVPAAPAVPAPVAAPAQPAASATAARPLVLAGSHYRCDGGAEFRVRFAEDAAVLDSPTQGSEQLLLDAGGVTPQQTVYSNARMRAEFGLGADGREAKLRFVPDQKVVACTRD